jgi:hypothetical protein
MFLILLVGELLFAQPGDQGRETFTKRLDYYVRDGGEWTSPNADYKAGSGQPHSYGYQWEWSLDKQIARLRIFGAFDGDKRATFWETIVAWHPTEQRALMRQIGASGAFADGWVAWPSEQSVEIRLTFVMPDGEIWAFREIDTIIGPDEFRTVSYRFKGGQWVEQQASSWKRVKKSARSPERADLRLPARTRLKPRTTCAAG